MPIRPSGVCPSGASGTGVCAAGVGAPRARRGARIPVLGVVVLAAVSLGACSGGGSGSAAPSSSAAAASSTASATSQQTTSSAAAPGAGGAGAAAFCAALKGSAQRSLDLAAKTLDGDKAAAAELRKLNHDLVDQAPADIRDAYQTMLVVNDAVTDEAINGTAPAPATPYLEQPKIKAAAAQQKAWLEANCPDVLKLLKG